MMSKIICDVCGTSYPETATQCPICGCVRPEEVISYITDSEGNEQSPFGTYTYVKGGRFSKSNVKKRSQGKMSDVDKDVPELKSKPKETTKTKVESSDSAPASGKADTGFVIAIVALLLAIVAVVIYIAVRFFVPGALPSGKADETTTGITTQQTENSTDTVETTLDTVAEIPCTDIVVSKTVIEFEKQGAALLLNVALTPSDTTDELVFLSSDPAVAEVSEEGKVTAVGNGQAVITISCGDMQAQCRVVCSFESDATEQTEPTTATNGNLKLNRDDFTLSRKGGTWDLYDGDIPADQITWSSDNEKVATIKDGIVTAVGGGYTTVYGEYQGTKVSCIVRCSFAPLADEEEPAQSNAATSVAISASDVSIKVGETFVLTLKDADGNTLDVVWTAADSSVCTIDGNNITGASAGSITTVSTEYQGTTYSCIVRIKDV